MVYLLYKFNTLCAISNRNFQSRMFKVAMSDQNVREEDAEDGTQGGKNNLIN